MIAGTADFAVHAGAPFRSVIFTLLKASLPHRRFWGLDEADDVPLAGIFPHSEGKYNTFHEPVLTGGS